MTSKFLHVAFIGLCSNPNINSDPIPDANPKCRPLTLSTTVLKLQVQ